VEFPEGDISFADRIVSLNPSSEGSAPYNDSTRALGPPDGDYLSIGNATTTCNSQVVFEFVDNYLIDTDGDDLWIFETGPAVEATDLYISQKGSDWISVGKIEGSTRGVDISSFVSPGQRFPFVRLCDFADGATSGGSTPGPDIDAVGAIGSVFRPENERETLPDDGQQGGGQQGTRPFPAATSRRRRSGAAIRQTSRG